MQTALKRWTVNDKRWNEKAVSRKSLVKADNRRPRFELSKSLFLGLLLLIEEWRLLCSRADRQYLIERIAKKFKCFPVVFYTNLTRLLFFPFICHVPVVATSVSLARQSHWSETLKLSFSTNLRLVWTQLPGESCGTHYLESAPVVVHSYLLHTGWAFDV
jgi:hypothetical protein